MLDSVSPVKDCNNGSIFTSVHTSVNNSAVKFLISLCLAIINPPLGQDRACCTLKAAPHTQFIGSNGIPYLMYNPSQKACLSSTNPCFLTAGL